MRRDHGFTLLEICLAVAIGLLLVMIAVPSVAGVLAQQRLHESFENFDGLVREAQRRSVDERRTYAILWKKGALELAAFDKTDLDATPGANDTNPGRISAGDGEEYIIDRTAALEKNPPPVWTFWRSGTCEPATITYKGPRGTWTARFDPLTTRGTILNEETL